MGTSRPKYVSVRNLRRDKHGTFANSKALYQSERIAAERRSMSNRVKALLGQIGQYKCEQCKYITTQKINLRNHVNAIHANIRPYKCIRCDYAATQKVNWQNHTKIKHRNKNKKGYRVPCPSSSFLSTAPLKVHEISGEKGRMSIKRRRFSCRVSEGRSMAVS